MYTHHADAAAAHGPMDAASQSTLFAFVTRHTPRPRPVVSSAKRSGSFPESLIEKKMPGCVMLIAAAEFSTRSIGAAVRVIDTWVGAVPIESVALVIAGCDSG